MINFIDHFEDCLFVFDSNIDNWSYWQSKVNLILPTYLFIMEAIEGSILLKNIEQIMCFIKKNASLKIKT
jgi:hypothetical protein